MSTGTFDLRRARINAGFSQRSLAALLGIDEHAVRRLELGERVHPATAKKVGDYFGVTVTDLMRWDGDEHGAAA